MRALAAVKFSVFLACLFFVLGVSLVAPQPAHAAGIQVNVTYDNSTNPDSDPLTVDPNDCSLREALQNANDDLATYPDCPAGSGADIITFSGGVTSITFDDQIFIGTDVTINGAVTFDGGNATRFFTVAATGIVTFNSVTMTNGSTSGGGGAIQVAVGGTLTVNQGNFDTNHADGNGGAIDSSGDLHLSQTIFQDNSAGGDGGAIIQTGGYLMTINLTGFLSNTAVERPGWGDL